jgi:hypothetical protein
MTRLRAAAGLAAVALVAGAAAASAAPAAPSVGPVAVGWWSNANRIAGAPAVAPPDVGPKDLYVAGSNSLPGALTDPTGAGPTAIAALQFRLPEGSALEQLHLTLSGVHPPAVTLTACRATETFAPAYDGAWADAPAYDCSDSGTARLAADGSVVIDGLDGLQDDRDVSVVLVPGPLDRVVLAPPDGHTGVLTARPGPVDAAPGAGAPLPPAGPSDGFPAAVGAVGTGTAVLPGAPASPAAAPAVAAPAGPVTAPSPTTLSRPALPTRPWPALLATLLVALAAFVPMVRPLRAPAATGGTRGVGRFRSERSGPVPELG